MDRMNVAYDLSFYEQEQERHIARKEKKESVIIKAQTKFSLGRKIANILSVAVMITLIVAVIAIKFFINFVSKHGFKAFGWYRIIIGGAILIMIACGIDLQIM